MMQASPVSTTVSGHTVDGFGSAMSVEYAPALRYLAAGRPFLLTCVVLLVHSSEGEIKSLVPNGRLRRRDATEERLLHTQEVNDAPTYASRPQGVMDELQLRQHRPGQIFAISSAINQGSLYCFGADSSSEMAPEHGFEP